MVIPPQHEYPRVPGRAVASRGRPPADVVELIMADHRRIRRLREALDDAVRRDVASGSAWTLGHVWERFTDLLEAHTRAEEEICYLLMYDSTPDPAKWRRAAVADHDDIREALGEAALQPAGSAPWWAAARAVLAINAGHLDREERDILDCWLPRLTMSRRHELGHQWQAFVSAWRIGRRGTPPAGVASASRVAPFRSG
jgi:Hemerythrin HHE cation binding domain